MSGFLGIVEKNLFHATNTAYLNDTSEVVRGRYEVVTTLLALMDAAGVSETVMTALKRLYVGRPYAPTFDLFAVCFSHYNNRLSQWRGYGRGVSIGFDRKKLTKVVGPNLSLNKIWYLDLDQEPFRTFNPQTAISNALSSLNWAHIRNDDFDTWRERIEEAAKILSVRCKHGGFAEEFEWRLLYRAPKKLKAGAIKFRMRGDAIVPFVEVASRHDIRGMITDVVVGPRDRTDEILALKSVDLLRERYRLKYRVDVSRIPFRG